MTKDYKCNKCGKMFCSDDIKKTYIKLSDRIVETYSSPCCDSGYKYWK